MKRTTFQMLLAVASATGLSACGGGGNESGSPTAFSAVPSTVTFTAPKGTTAGVCTGGGSSQIFVYGGVAPYRLDNTLPAYITLDRTTVDQKGGFFTVTTTGPCVNPGQVVVIDSLDHQIVVTVINQPASATP
jgi:hypothetical protein